MYVIITHCNHYNACIHYTAGIPPVASQIDPLEVQEEWWSKADKESDKDMEKRLLEFLDQIQHAPQARGRRDVAVTARAAGTRPQARCRRVLTFGLTRRSPRRKTRLCS